MLQFDIHYTNPSVERLTVHMPFGNNIVYTEDDNLQQVLTNPNNRTTKLTAWFEANRTLPGAAQYTFAEFPEHFTWHASGKYWGPRCGNHKIKIGQVANVSPNRGEEYYLCLLLHIVKGARSYLGLLGDDREWSAAMFDAAHWALPYQLRELFVTLLFCDVTNPLELFDKHVNKMGEDATYYATNGVLSPSNLCLGQYIRSYVLTEVDNILRNAGYSLSHFKLPQPSMGTKSIFYNRLLMDELAYDVDRISAEASEQLSKLNLNQRSIHDAIMCSLDNAAGQTFFIYGYGGTGKTFLWNLLLNSIRARGKVALAVASPGIASLLLPGGRTSHSRFKIPLDIHEHSVCTIKKNTHLSELIQQTSLIIWDEAPVNHKHCFEALDRTLRDIRTSDGQDLGSRQFGGITVVLGGDFR